MSKKQQGILCILSAAFFFALMNLFVRLSGDLPTIQKSFFRNFIAAILAAVMLLKNHTRPGLTRENGKDLLMRSVAGTVGILCNFYAVDHLNIADASMLNKLSPFFAMLFSAVLLGETATRYEWGTLVVAFGGALLVAKPTFDLRSLPALIGLIGGVGAGLAYTYVRKLGKAGVPGSVIVFFFSCFSCLVTLPSLILQYTPMRTSQLLTLILAGCAAAGGQISITQAYTKAPASEISVYDYSQILFAAMLGFFFLDQIPDKLSILGYVVIIGAAVMKWRHTNRAS